MIDTLITYLHFGRIPDLQKYFATNHRILHPKRSIVYVDNISRDDFWKLETVKNAVNQLENTEIVTGIWNDRTLCVMQIIKDLSLLSFNRAMIIDSDNVLFQNIQELDDMMNRKGYDYYTILNEECDPKMFSTRSVSLDDNISLYRITGVWKGVYFIGPKQAIIMGKEFLKKLDLNILDAISSSMKEVTTPLRLGVSDETTLGMLLYYSRIRQTPYIIASKHYHTPHDIFADPLYTAAAHVALGSRLLKRIKSRRLFWYLFRYKFALIGRTIIR